MNIRNDRKHHWNAVIAVAGVIGTLLLTCAPTANAQSGLRMDQVYMLQPHNSYEHSAQLSNWLNAGYRTLELDVQDQTSWWTYPRGPYVAHDGGPVNNNCSGTADRLADCLDDIVAWQNAHPGEAPVVVFIDMKTRPDNLLSAWGGSRIDALDSFVSGYLGARLYRYSDLRNHIAGGAGATAREKLKAVGWPGFDALRGRIIVGFTGGRIGAVNQGMADMIGLRGAAANAFMCPDIDAPDPGEVSGTVDGMSAAASGQMLCANVKAGDHYQLVANRTAEYRQMMHLWSAAGDFNSTSFEATYIAMAHGVSAVGMDVTNSLSDPNVFMPTWTSTIPLVGVRRGLPGYFTLRPKSASGTRCIGTRNNGYSNGSQIDQEFCTGGSDQQFVYTAEGQLRPRGSNPYCMDISGGSAGSGKAMHLWNCDGGSSEKWRLTPSGQLRSVNNSSYCATVPGGSLSTGLQLRTEVCGTSLSQQFELLGVADWPQTSF
ncbi:MAG: ricin-type beta-trefoil lectin domain protein [Xanthomonadales bacterium]|nr:ricin-type beta-trefoil lectin domain protein [Xanthomonadales bacterium]